MGISHTSLLKRHDSDIILFCLPPHTTHDALQPLDVSVFKSLKDQYSKAIRAVSFTKMSKRKFSRVVKALFERAFSIPTIKSGFKKCGIYPFSPDVIPKDKITPSTLHDLSSALLEILQFIYHLDHLILIHIPFYLHLQVMKRMLILL